MEEMMKIAKMILDINPNASLTGTLMLKLRGIDLGREPKDIDILINNHAPCIKFPEELTVIEKGVSSDGWNAKYEISGFVIDVLSDGECPEEVNGVKLGTLKGLMNAKYNYSKQSNPDAEKHHNDLIKLGFDFEAKQKEDDEMFNNLIF